MTYRATTTRQWYCLTLHLPPYYSSPTLLAVQGDLQIQQDDWNYPHWQTLTTTWRRTTLTHGKGHHHDAVRHTILGTVCCTHDTLYTRSTSDGLYLSWIAAVLERLTQKRHDGRREHGHDRDQSYSISYPARLQHNTLLTPSHIPSPHHYGP